MGVRHRIIHERTGHQLTVIVVNRAFEQSLTEPLYDTAVYLAFDNHRIDDCAEVVDGRPSHDLGLSRVAVDFDFEGHAATL